MTQLFPLVVTSQVLLISLIIRIMHFIEYEAQTDEHIVYNKKKIFRRIGYSLNSEVT